MSTPLAFMLDRNIGVTRKAQAAVAAIAAQGNPKAGVDAIMLDNQLLIMMAVRELLARQARAETPKPVDLQWYVGEHDLATGRARIA